MERLFEKKEYVLRFYTKYSKYIDKILQFILALLTFVFINNNIGFMKTVSNPIVTLGLALICTFLPRLCTVLMAALLTLVQFYAFSIGVAIAAAAIFIVMFIMYFRFAQGKTQVLLFVPIAFMFKVPVLMPITYGLIGNPVCMIPIAFGTVVYYMISYVKSYATTIGDTGTPEMIGQMTAFLQQLFTNRELWLTLMALTICLLLVYNIRRLSVDNSWKIAIVTGAVVNIIIMSLGAIVFNTHISYLALILGSIAAAVLALVLEFAVFSVDYSRTEHLQFEDDEYYYYVKAVPKVSVAVPEKIVKRINERQETSAIDTDAVQASLKKTKKKTKGQNSHAIIQETDEMILSKTLQEELDIQKIIEDELKL